MKNNPEQDRDFMRKALRLARRAYGLTAPNPMVGAVLVKSGRIIGRGWHHRAGAAHAEIEALRDAEASGHSAKGATMYVTLEPCSTRGRTPPCTDAIVAAGIRRVVAATTDPNPRHAGRGFLILKQAGLSVTTGVLERSAMRLNEAFNHWIVHQTPFVTVKSAMTLDGKIATATGESRWITCPEARDLAMHLRQGADAVLVGINTVLADDPHLTLRPSQLRVHNRAGRTAAAPPKVLRRIILDSRARTPLSARVVSDEQRQATIVVVGRSASPKRVRQLEKRTAVWKAPLRNRRIDLRWLLERLGAAQVTHLLVEGGGVVSASFLMENLAQRVVFFYAPKILGGKTARKAVAGAGAKTAGEILRLSQVRWQRLGSDLVLTANPNKTPLPVFHPC